MLKHGRAGVPMEVMGLMLGEFIDDYTVQVIDVFAMPQSGTTVTVESVDHVFQQKMVEMLKPCIDEGFVIQEREVNTNASWIMNDVLNIYLLRSHWISLASEEQQPALAKISVFAMRRKFSKRRCYHTSQWQKVLKAKRHFSLAT